MVIQAEKLVFFTKRVSPHFWPYGRTDMMTSSSTPNCCCMSLLCIMVILFFSRKNGLSYSINDQVNSIFYKAKVRTLLGFKTLQESSCHIFKVLSTSHGQHYKFSKSTYNLWLTCLKICLHHVKFKLLQPSFSGKIMAIRYF